MPCYTKTQRWAKVRRKYGDSRRYSKSFATIKIFQQAEFSFFFIYIVRIVRKSLIFRRNWTLFDGISQRSNTWQVQWTNRCISLPMFTRLLEIYLLEIAQSARNMKWFTRYSKSSVFYNINRWNNCLPSLITFLNNILEKTNLRKNWKSICEYPNLTS